ncbi:U3 small nucleolar RNA-associated protein 18 homolog, partial [Tachysurus ichikawai]
MEEETDNNTVKRPLMDGGAAPVEEHKRRKHNEEVMKTLGQEDESVKLLEDLVFGAEEELLQRLQ